MKLQLVLNDVGSFMLFFALHASPQVFRNSSFKGSIL